jgi:E3 ubiquitin-protein ligase listerin
MAIVTSVTEFAPEPPRLDRYRNELASSMLGIPASKADTEGLLLLQRLAATAPDPDSAAVFLTQQRAVNVMKTCQQWITSDEDISEEVESAMTLIFFHIAPILQNVPGAHWDLIFDIVETNLEV